MVDRCDRRRRQDSFGVQGNAAPAALMRAALFVPVTLVVVAIFQSCTGATWTLEAQSPLRTPLLLAASGLGVGCYGTLVGIGGGPLIVPVLVFSFGWEASDIVATSLLIVFLNALSGTTGYAWQRRIDYAGGLSFSMAAVPGAVASALVHHLLHIQTFDTIFGVFLLGLAGYCAVGIRSLDRTSRAHRAAITPPHRIVAFRDRLGVQYRFGVNDRLGVRLNLVLGFFVGFLGIGGGVLQVPLLVYVLRYPIHVATATSHFVTMLTCLFALAPNLVFDNVRFGEALWMGLGVVFGAQAGAWLSPKIGGKGIMWLFVAVLVLFSVRLLGN